MNSQIFPQELRIKALSVVVEAISRTRTDHLAKVAKSPLNDYVLLKNGRIIIHIDHFRTRINVKELLKDLNPNEVLQFVNREFRKACINLNRGN
jgi:hypothetical protein